MVDRGLHEAAEASSSVIDIKYSILKRGNIVLNLYNKESLRIDIKRMINSLTTHSKETYPTFKGLMTGIFKGVELKGDKTFRYNIDKKIKSEKLYNDEELESLGFLTKSEEMVNILLKWI